MNRVDRIFAWSKTAAKEISEDSGPLGQFGADLIDGDHHAKALEAEIFAELSRDAKIGGLRPTRKMLETKIDQWRRDIQEASRPENESYRLRILRRVAGRLRSRISN